MDTETIRNHFKSLFGAKDDHEKRITTLEIHQDNLKNSHSDHSDKMEEHGQHISKHSAWIGKIAIGGCVLLFVADKLGIFEKLK